ncbi:MAG: MAPEG family protein [Parvularculaceae bacterium]
MIIDEIFILILTALLASSLWIPYVIGVNSTPYDGPEDFFQRPPDQKHMVAWVHRAHRAHANMLEQFAPFAAVVLIGAAVGVSNAATLGLALAFLIVRVAHAVGMIGGWMGMPLRPIVFTAGWLVTLAYAGVVLANRG